MAKNRTGLKGLDKFEKDPRVKAIWAEGARDRSGMVPHIWAQLSPGWNRDGCTAVNGFSVKDFCQQMKGVEKNG